MKLSIIIVSYNVEHLILALLDSLAKALPDKLSHEIIVIDNNSSDNTVSSIRKYFPRVILIENNVNIGFAAANNKGIQKASGKYLVLINPDTLVEETLLKELFDFMETHPEYGAVTGKMLNPDGSFAKDTRHGLPTPQDAFYKSIGLSALFPGSKRFAYYHQTFLPVNKSCDIPALSGAFMFLRAEAVQQTGFFDENFFMYCEDIDYCLRLNKNRWKIHYLPKVRLLHFKGESTKRKDHNYFFNFNKSLFLYFKKHHANKNILFSAIVKSGIWLRGLGLIVFNLLKSSIVTITDLLLLNLPALIIDGNSSIKIPIIIFLNLLYGITFTVSQSNSKTLNVVPIKNTLTEAFVALFFFLAFSANFNPIKPIYFSLLSPFLITAFRLAVSSANFKQPGRSVIVIGEPSAGLNKIIKDGNYNIKHVFPPLIHNKLELIKNIKKSRTKFIIFDSSMGFGTIFDLIEDLQAPKMRYLYYFPRFEFLIGKQ